MIKTFIFDLGNVIVKVDHNSQYKKFASKSNKTLADIKNYVENSLSAKAFAKGKLTPKQFYEKMSKELNLNISFDEFKALWCDIFTLNESIAKLIQKLKKSYRLVLLSNTDMLHFEHIKNKYKIIDIFDDYVLSYKAGCMKPNPIIFLHTLKKAKALPFNCVYIDDMLQFVFVARLMGIRAFRFKNAEKLTNDLIKFGVMRT